jgi:hypothetical protein
MFCSHEYSVLFQSPLKEVMFCSSKQPYRTKITPPPTLFLFVGSSLLLQGVGALGQGCLTIYATIRVMLSWTCLLSKWNFWVGVVLRSGPLSTHKLTFSPRIYSLSPILAVTRYLCGEPGHVHLFTLLLDILPVSPPSGFMTVPLSLSYHNCCSLDHQHFSPGQLHQPPKEERSF